MTYYSLQTFGGFCVSRDHRPVPLPPEVERLVAFLAIHQSPLPRSFVAGTLWNEGSESRALGNLRSVLWRLRQSQSDLVVAGPHSVGLSEHLHCDVADVRDRAQRLLHAEVIDLRSGDTAGLSASVGSGANCPIYSDPVELLDHHRFGREFLPGWYDEWVLVEREKMRQLCLHALESIADRHAAQYRHGPAIQALLAAIALDDLRESPRRRLMLIYLDEGNPTEAIRHYEDYQALLDKAMGLKPSREMQHLVASIRDSAQASDVSR